MARELQRQALWETGMRHCYGLIAVKGTATGALGDRHAPLLRFDRHDQTRDAVHQAVIAVGLLWHEMESARETPTHACTDRCAYWPCCGAMGQIPVLVLVLLLVLYRFVQGLGVQSSGDKVRSRWRQSAQPMYCTVLAEAPAPAEDAGTMLRCYGPTKAFP